MSRSAPPSFRPTQGAFTLIELLVVLAVIAILAGLLLPAVTRSIHRGRQAACAGNLRQQGAAYHMFSHDHQSRFPQHVGVLDGGASESNAVSPTVGRVFVRNLAVFQSLSNLLATPRVLVCPSTRRATAPGFQSLTADRVNYFSGLRADYQNLQTILGADDHAGIRPLSATESGGRAGTRGFAWTGSRHLASGNVLFADARVESVRNLNRLEAITSDPLSTDPPSTEPAPPPPGATGQGRSDPSPSGLTPGPIRNPGAPGNGAPSGPFRTGSGTGGTSGTSSSLNAVPDGTPAARTTTPPRPISPVAAPRAVHPGLSGLSQLHDTPGAREAARSRLDATDLWILRVLLAAYLAILAVSLIAVAAHVQREWTHRPRIGTVATGTYSTPAHASN